MSGPFERSPALEALGVDHGFGLRGSERAAPVRLHRARQVHGRELRRAPLASSGVEADALWTDAPGEAVCVATADCVPILLADSRRRAVAALHAGWRGTAARIARHAVARLADELGADPADFVAALGPHIGVCCYEVDDPVREAMGDPRSFHAAGRSGHYMLDLFEGNRRQLLSAGLSPANVHRVGGCTACDPGRYVSYRRRDAGRMLHYVRMPSA